MSASENNDEPPSEESSLPRLGEIRFLGIPASPGIAIARCLVLQYELFDTSIGYDIEPARREEESTRYERALSECIDTLHSTYVLAEKEIGNVASILETYELILTDITINDGIRNRIATGVPAELAVATEYDEKRQLFVGMKDPMLRERASDLDNVRDRLLMALRHQVAAQTVADDVVVVASSLIPHDIVLFNEQGARGIVTELGGITSHACIMARSLALPAVIGVKNITAHVKSDSELIIDGNEGIIIVNPEPATLDHYRLRELEQQEIRKRYASTLHVKATTRDGRNMRLLANVDSPEEVTEALSMGAEGVGLVRTEMQMIRYDRFPSEEEQTQWYTAIAERVYPRPVTFRAFDVGTDKYVSGLPHERNPALGMRGIRYLLQRNDIFRSQLRAVLRTSHLRNVRFMLPMVTGLSEIEDTLLLLASAKEELAAQGVAFDAALPIGMMIETPSAALLADHFARRLQFFSIGSNDLTQYVLAADRGSDSVSGIFDTFNPAVLRLMKSSVDAAHGEGIDISVCGEFGSHSAATDLLIGMGIDSLSVPAPLIPELKNRILHASHSESLQIFEEAVKCSRPGDVRKTLDVIRGRF